MWEKAKHAACGRPWLKVAEDLVAALETSWPAKLCSLEHATQIGVALDGNALAQRFKRLAKRRTPMKHYRARALKVISQSGQLASPPDGMTLWQYFGGG